MRRGAPRPVCVVSGGRGYLPARGVWGSAAPLGGEAQKAGPARAPGLAPVCPGASAESGFEGQGWPGWLRAGQRAEVLGMRRPLVLIKAGGAAGRRGAAHLALIRRSPVPPAAPCTDPRDRPPPRGPLTAPGGRPCRPSGGRRAAGTPAPRPLLPSPAARPPCGCCPPLGDPSLPWPPPSCHPWGLPRPGRRLRVSACAVGLSRGSSLRTPCCLLTPGLTQVPPARYAAPTDKTLGGQPSLSWGPGPYRLRPSPHRGPTRRASQPPGSQSPHPGPLHTHTQPWLAPRSCVGAGSTPGLRAYVASEMPSASPVRCRARLST